MSHRNVIDFQRMAAIRQRDREIAAMHEEGYSVEVDRLLDERSEAIARYREDQLGGGFE